MESITWNLTLIIDFEQLLGSQKFPRFHSSTCVINH